MENNEFPKRINDYEITQPLGMGEFTSVYLAINLKTQQKAAIKVYRGPYLHDKLFQKRFDRELNIVSHLDHPNLVKYLDSGKHKDYPFIVMEYLTGVTLQRLIAHHGSAHPIIAIGIMKLALSALAYLHRGGIVHRDIKPSAIFISPQGQVKLADFDIAKRADDKSLTVKGTVVGSPKYMAPEQRLGELATIRSDVYSAGITFYELLTGKTPWENADFLPTDRRAWANYTPPSHQNPKINPKIDQIIAKAIDLQPGRRYDSAQEMLQELKQLETASREDIASWARGRKLTQKPDTKKTQPKLSGIWLASLVVGIVCLLAAILSTPTIVRYFSTTPTPTVLPAPVTVFTPTPYIFVLTVDTVAKKFTTSESLIVPGNSQVIIINPTHGACEVLATWNGVQVIIPATVIFPDRSCP